MSKRPSVRILGKLARAGQRMQPRFTPLDPDLIARRKVGWRTVERAQTDFRLVFPEAEKPAAADGAEAAAGEGGDLAVMGKAWRGQTAKKVKAEPLDLRQSAQWQRPVRSGSPSTL